MEVHGVNLFHSFNKICCPWTSTTWINDRNINPCEATWKTLENCKDELDNFIDVSTEDFNRKFKKDNYEMEIIFRVCCIKKISIRF
jgi:hypothetical protein